MNFGVSGSFYEFGGKQNASTGTSAEQYSVEHINHLYFESPS